MREIKFRYRIADRGSGEIVTVILTLEEIELQRYFPGTYVLSRDQYTGLHDKNGVEIYEGDVYVADGLLPCEVKFKDGSFYGEGSQETLSLDVDYYGELEVIGNIYGNPELLSESKIPQPHTPNQKGSALNDG